MFASWAAPNAGTFLWLKLHNMSDTKVLIEEKAAAANVLFVLGQAFDPIDKPSPYVRATYSIVSRDGMNIAVKSSVSLCNIKGKERRLLYIQMSSFICSIHVCALQ